MKTKLIVAMVSGEKTEAIIDAAREGGATGATVVHSGRGEGLKPQKTFLGLDLSATRDIVMFVVAQGRARNILERIRAAGRFDDEPGTGIALQVDIEDAVGLATQRPTILEEVEEDL